MAIVLEQKDVDNTIRLAMDAKSKVESNYEVAVGEACLYNCFILLILCLEDTFKAGIKDDDLNRIALQAKHIINKIKERYGE